MNHERYGTYAALHSSGQLGPREQQDFEEHAAECPSCQELAQEFSSISGLMFSAKAASLADSSSEQLKRFRERALREGVLVGSRSPDISRSLVVLSLCLVLLVASFAYLHNLRPSSTNEQAIDSHQQTSANTPGPASASGNLATATPIRIMTRRRRASASAQTDTPLVRDTLPQDFAHLTPRFQPLTASGRKTLAALEPSVATFQPVFTHDFPDTSYLTVGAAQLEYPDEMHILQPHDFAANMRQLHFRLPITP